MGNIFKKINGILAEGIAHRIWGHALYSMDKLRWEEAQRLCEKSVAILEAGSNTIEIARTYVIWVQICAEQGQIDVSRRYWQKAITSFEKAGLSWEQENVQEFLKS